ncbi:Uncharacterised protein [Escherichia coli]|uniref:PTS EIIB type-4 domain-containing protein n=1 Tax=Escherichia coli TaxID=562 RepID=A0A376FQJ8_ECOLX|nr:Uncharacterised protein [Escherichia coli]
MNITLARIDDRLIHGQVTPSGRKWLTPSALLSAMTKFITMKFAGHYCVRLRHRE